MSASSGKIKGKLNRVTSDLTGKRVLKTVAILLLFFMIMPLFSRKGEYDGKKIRKVVFHGLNNAHHEELLPLLSLQGDDVVDSDLLNEDLKALFATTYFSNIVLRIQVHANDTVTLHYEVWELPRISRIEFIGVDELYPADIIKLIGFKEGDVFSLQKVKNAVPIIKEKYLEEGLFLAEVWYKVGDLRKSSNSIEVTYIVDEGEDIPISKINLIGLDKLDPDEIREIMEQKEESFMEDGIFREGTFEEDKLKIMAFAKSRGFLDATYNNDETDFEIRWRNPAKPEEGRVVVITYSVNEGEIRYYGGYSLEHDPNFINQERNPPERKLKAGDKLNPVYPPEFLLGYLELSEEQLGDVFDEGKFFRDRGTLQEYYSQQGYVFAQIQPTYINFKLDEKTILAYEECSKIESPRNETEQKCRDEAKQIDLEKMKRTLIDEPEKRNRVLRHVHFSVRENSLAYIENIIIKGMEKTRENVIRRELLIKEGQLFNSALVQRSREKIANLGYFKEVNLKSTPGSDETKMNLIIDVTEQPTGTISMGGGYGTSSGFMIFTEIGENNLNGTGQKISGRLDYGPTRRNVSLTWTDPWIYEVCQNNTGRFWRQKQEAFDNAPSLADILQIADSLQNENRKLGELIAGFVEKTDGDYSIETMDGVKVKIRRLLRSRVGFEEECYRSIPRPWSLTLRAFWNQSERPTIPLFVEGLVAQQEIASIEHNQLGLMAGVSHTFLLNWAHYHRYSPSWSRYSNPTALVNDEKVHDVELGWQFKSSLVNGIIYDTRDSVFNTTTGSNLDMSIEVVGQALGGQKHYNRYTLSASHYFWWFDYTLGGLIRKNSLRRWRVVQEIRLSGVFTHETAPFSGQIFPRRRSLLERINPFRRPKQNKEINPYMDQEDRLKLGGYETLRGYDYMRDRNFPETWYRFDGGSHMLLGSTELRFPIEPSVLWFIFFLDSGSVYNNLGELTGVEKEYVDEYDNNINLIKSRSDQLTFLMADKFNLSNQSLYFHGSKTAWDDPRRTVFSQRNVSLERTLFSWGFGFRIQIPVLPLRLYMAQKLYYKNGKLKPIPGDSDYEFVFGIGDYRFF